MTFNKIKLQNGVNLYVRHSDQFKTVNFSVKWNSNLENEKSSARAVLSNILQDSNALYPTQSKLRDKLDEMYGTVLYTDVSKRADTHTVSLNVESVNDEYLADGGVIDETIELIKTVIFEPNMEDGYFNTAIFEREKRSVIERIRSQYDDKTSYAQKRMLEIIRPNSPVSASSDGTEEDVRALTPEKLLSAYESMINEDDIDIYVIGDIDVEEIAEKLKQVLNFKPRTNSHEKVFTPIYKAPVEIPQRIREQQAMKQGKLHMGFTTPVTFHHPDYSKMQVMNGVFGGFSHSKLFINVREKESMAYYASSSYSSHYGFIYVMAGIDAELEEKAVNLIREQLKVLQNGDVTDLELKQTIALLRNSITSAFDSARGQIEIFDQYKELDEHFTAEKLIAKWEAVTKQDIIEIASDINLEIIYLLSGKEAAVSEESTIR